MNSNISAPVQFQPYPHSYPYINYINSEEQQYETHRQRLSSPCSFNNELTDEQSHPFYQTAQHAGHEKEGSEGQYRDYNSANSETNQFYEYPPKPDYTAMPSYNNHSLTHIHKQPTDFVYKAPKAHPRKLNTPKNGVKDPEQSKLRELLQSKKMEYTTIYSSNWQKKIEYDSLQSVLKNVCQIQGTTKKVVEELKSLEKNITERKDKEQQKHRNLIQIMEEELKSVENTSQHSIKELQLLQNIQKKEEELKGFRKAQQEITLKVNTEKQCIQQEITDKLQTTNSLKTQRQQLENSLKQWKDKRFELNQKYFRQQRMLKDLDHQIQRMSRQIKEEAAIDEKLRLENLKKMEECEEFSFEKLREAKEKNHSYKLTLLRINKENEDHQKLLEELVPLQQIQQIQLRIDRRRQQINEFQKMQKQILFQSDPQSQTEKQQSEKVDQEIQKCKQHEQSIQGQLRSLKKLSNSLQTRIKQLKTKAQTQRRQNDEVQCVKVDKKMAIKMKDESNQPNGKCLQSKQSLIQAQPSKRKGQPKLGEFYVKKQTNIKSLIFTLLYLMLLVVAASNYSKISLWILMKF